MLSKAQLHQAYQFFIVRCWAIGSTIFDQLSLCSYHRGYINLRHVDRLSLLEHYTCRTKGSTMRPATPGEWYIAVVCEQCNHRVMLFHDLSEGQSDLANSKFLITCPSCNKRGSYPAEHFQAASMTASCSRLRMTSSPFVYYSPSES